MEERDTHVDGTKTPELLVDFITSLDGYGAAEGGRRLKPMGTPFQDVLDVRVKGFRVHPTDHAEGS
jgi:hypothetical protein